jgi:nucleotide-binding universal stress UspA family protein
VPTLVVSATNDVAPSVAPKFKRILCGVNLHLSSLEALRFALSMATESDAELRIVSVLEPLAAVLPLGAPTHVIAEHRHHQRQLSLHAIRQHVPDEARQACTIREEVGVGEPVDTLIGIAQANAAELLIVGTGDRPHLQSLWRGRTTDRLIRNSSCPVLVSACDEAIRRLMGDGFLTQDSEGQLHRSLSAAGVEPRSRVRRAGLRQPHEPSGLTAA